MGRFSIWEVWECEKQRIRSGKNRKLSLVFKKGNVLKQVRLESGLEKSPGKWEVSVMDIPVSEGWIIWLYFVVEGVWSVVVHLEVAVFVVVWKEMFHVKTADEVFDTFRTYAFDEDVIQLHFL